MLLGLDLGTTNVKALVTDFAGQPLGEGACAVPLYEVGTGGVEQNIEEIWTATLTAVKEAVRAAAPADIQAIGVSSQGGALQILDAQGRPAARVISWLDERWTPFGNSLTSELGPQWFAQRIGHGSAAFALGQLLRLRDENPEALAAPNRIGFVGDVIVSRLCGRPAHDGTSCSLALLYNPVRRDYDPELLARLGINSAQLPALLSQRVPAGGLLASVAQAVGLRAGIPVSAAVHDQYAAALGVRAVQAGTMMVGTGTAWVLLAVSATCGPPATPDAFVCHHVVEDLWGQILSLINGGSAVAWALELAGHKRAAGEEVDRLLASAPAGSDGVQCWPFLTALRPAGLAPGTKGRLAGLQLSHGPGHIVRAVLEGLGYELRRHIGLLRRAGLAVERLVLSGSAATSRVTPRLLASVTELPLACFGSGAGSPLGAAIIARGLCERATPLAALAEAMAPSASRVEPGADAVAYRAAYETYLGSLPLLEGGAG
ncbi:MAG TPA: FGGY family carbohydrate kinase [Candidatus Paceibacterota bacterium]|nr:FGGY family carbohydrate kinase [Verrucomicrobiota bacterium]HSA11160.1 FGGY family carbohydrate kinase [Candidatus Paceibacterota bacterium]